MPIRALAWLLTIQEESADNAGPPLAGMLLNMAVASENFYIWGPHVAIAKR